MGTLWGDVQFDYPWIIWERSYGDSKFFFNLISHEYTSIQNFGDNGNGVLHDGKLFYVDTDQSQANSPEYGWLKSYNLGNHRRHFSDLKTVSNSNFYEVLETELNMLCFDHTCCRNRRSAYSRTITAKEKGK